MNLNSDLNIFSIPVWLRLSGSFLSALIITWVAIPTIVKISKYKKLYDFPNERTSHINETPNLGGLAMFAGFTVATVVFTLNAESSEIKYFLGSLVVIFFIGLKDDIMVIDPRKKLLGQIVAALIVILPGGIRVTSFHHAFGIDEISVIPSILFTLFLLLVLINGFNLIDGIDGLSSGIGIIASVAYGIWFILTRHITYGVLSIALAGALAAFFPFNVFGKKNKIFLGDAGSLITGLSVSVLTVKFLETELTAPGKLRFEAAPSIAFALLIIPLFDTMRIFVLRLWNGQSPFKADHNHIHHSLLSLGLSHMSVTLVMVSFSILFVLISLLLQGLGNVLSIIILILLAFLLSCIPELIMRNKAG